MKLLLTLTAGSNDERHQKALEETGFWGRQAAGCLVMAENQLLFNHRSAHVLEPNTWGTWGGAIDEDESPRDAVVRELREEAGYKGRITKVVPLLVFQSKTFRYSNFLVVVPKKFTPKLDWESQGFKWAGPDNAPTPMHPGLKALLTDRDSIRTIDSLRTNIRAPQATTARACPECGQAAGIRCRKLSCPQTRTDK